MPKPATNRTPASARPASKTITARMHRPARRWGNSHGVTTWTYSRIMSGRVVTFDITHNRVTGTAVLRVYPSGGWTVPAHELTLPNTTAEQIGRLVYRTPAMPAAA